MSATGQTEHLVVTRKIEPTVDVGANVRLDRDLTELNRPTKPVNGDFRVRRSTGDGKPRSGRFPSSFRGGRNGMTGPSCCSAGQAARRWTQTVLPIG